MHAHRPAHKYIYTPGVADTNNLEVRKYSIVTTVSGCRVDNYLTGLTCANVCESVVCK